VTRTAPEGGELRPFLAAAVELAAAAGAALGTLGLGRGLQVESKGLRRELVTAADREAERIVVGGLQQRFPDHGVLAEEGVLTEQGRSSRAGDWLWIVDPLDGTTNFVHGLPFYCVAVALAFRGEVVLGAVHAPALGQSYAAARGLGARRNGAPIEVSDTAQLGDALLGTGFAYVRDEPGRDDNVGRIGRVLPSCRDLRRFGSAQLDLCLVGAGHLDAYWELYLAPYDVAAGAVIVQEAGGTVTDLEGGSDWLSGGQILASNGRLHRDLLARLGPLRG
jgi:myo-inositol-1(or 4)-monophosphatase